MRTILTVFALLFLASCQDAAVTGNDPSNTTTLSARVQRAQGVSTAVYDSTYTVNVSLTAGSSYQRTLTPAFSDHGCDFTGVPVGVPYTLSFQGLNRSGTMIWSGTATGTTASSTTDGSVSATSVTVVVSPTTARDSTLSVLSTNPGTFTATFSRTNTNYVDSVAAGVTSVTVTATASTPGDVSVITYNSQTNNVATLSTTDPTAILVVVTNRNGNSLTYTIKVYHKKAAVIDSTFGIPWNSNITYGALLDPRDGQTYRTVQIGSQVWMARNLNYAGNGMAVGVCYGNSTDSCGKYGRLYTWKEAMMGSPSSNTNPSGVQGVCPSGWHLPSDTEWSILQTTVDVANTVDALKLKSISGWSPNGSYSGNGSDIYGFRGLPGGDSAGIFANVGLCGYWWSSSTYDSTYAKFFSMGYTSSFAVRYITGKSIGNSIRCVGNSSSSSSNVATPTFSISGGTFTSSQSVSLSTTTSGASIYYTIDGSTPTTSSAVYNGAISVTGSETIKAIAVKSGMTNSPVSSANFTIPILSTVASPTFSVPMGTYPNTQSVSLSTTTSGASIYYTVDGSTPTVSSAAYSGAISVTASETIKAIATKNGMTNSIVSSAAYTISTSTTIPWNTSINYRTLNDPRDGKLYKTVVIGTQTWMAENLNYAGNGTTVGVCYGGSTDSCTKYGRLYTWTEAMAGSASSTASPSGVQGVCPTGWHLPSDAEWTKLTDTIIDSSSAGTNLKSMSGWLYNGSASGGGMDTYGFRALPGGIVTGGTINVGTSNVGYSGYWWSTTEIYGKNAWYRNMGFGAAFVQRNWLDKSQGYSLRCIQTQ